VTHDEIETYAKSNGHPPVAAGVVLVDFDGTISPWGDLFGFPEPLPGAKEFLDFLNRQGYTIVLFTSRLSSVWHSSEGRNVATGMLQQVEYLQEYIKRYELPIDSATAEKIPAIAYIDDRAVEFLGWAKTKRRFNAKLREDARARE
jgi:hypothetical protein